jgi:hypothetical protein
MWQRIILGHFLGTTWSSYSQSWSGLSAIWQCIVLAPQREMAMGAISPVNLLLLLDLLSPDFERLHIISTTPMILDTTTCSGQGKTHAECAALSEGFVAHIFAGLDGDRMQFTYF